MMVYIAPSSSSPTAMAAENVPARLVQMYFPHLLLYLFFGSPVAYPAAHSNLDLIHRAPNRATLMGYLAPPMRDAARSMGNVSNACWWPRWTQLNLTDLASFPVAYIAGNSTPHSVRALPTLKESAMIAKDAPTTLVRTTRPNPFGRAGAKSLAP